MIPFELLRSALLTADPPSALDRLIREQQAAGRKVSHIYDDLIEHIEQVRTMPEYVDCMEDWLGDKLDALCGWVHPSSQYRDSEMTPANQPAPFLPDSLIPDQITPR